MKTAFGGLISRFDTTKERISEYEEYYLLPKETSKTIGKTTIMCIWSSSLFLAPKKLGLS